MVVLATTRGMARIGVRGLRTAWESWLVSGAVLIEMDVYRIQNTEYRIYFSYVHTCNALQ